MIEPVSPDTAIRIHIINADDWILVYRDEQLVHSGHGGPGWARAMTLAGPTVAVRQAFIDGAGERQIEELCGEAPATLDEANDLATRLGIQLIWHAEPALGMSS